MSVGMVSGPTVRKIPRIVIWIGCGILGAGCHVAFATRPSGSLSAVLYQELEHVRISAFTVRGRVWVRGSMGADKEVKQGRISAL